ncbi:MAG: hypothetical protein GXO93_05355 [FCB group bacterium]|nr:hypothetical protein [FCB group bacterium]
MSTQKWPKPVIITTRFGANYLWHILAVAKISYDSEYADTYQLTINPDDLRYLQSKKSLLEFGAGEGGELSVFFTFIPAWLHLETDSQFQKYFDVLNDALRENSFSPVIDAFRYADWSDCFMAEFIKQTQSLVEHKNLIETADKLSDIYLRNMAAYRQTVWKQAQEELKQRAFELNQHFQETDYIYKWEQFLGILFAAKQYEIVLCYANKNGPDHNSLGYSGNLFY